jgi:RNA polymerase sigma-70 factor (ECF subfamily)
MQYLYIEHRCRIACSSNRQSLEPAERQGRPKKRMSDTILKEASAEFRSALVESIPHLRAFARSLTRNRDRADDLVHDAAVRALAAADQFRPGTNFKAWVFTILRNLYYNEGRRDESRNVPFDETTATEHAIPATQEAALEFCDFRRAFWQLGEDHREVLMLVGASGLDYEEVAKVCDCAVGTIKSRVSRARQKLTRLLSEDMLKISRGDSASIGRAGPIEPDSTIRATR